MDTEQTDSIDIGVDEKPSENFNVLASLAEQKLTFKIDDGLKKELKEGDCYIFNYQKFENLVKSLSPRGGSEKDAARLKHDFMQLNLDVHSYTNLSYGETFNVLKEASVKDHSKSKCFICCILTHGSQNGGLWAKDKKMYIDDILVLFSESSFLKEIPKIFIIEACQGKEAELCVSTDSVDSGISRDTEDYLDFLIANSTYADAVSFKTSSDKEEKCHGSFFIDEFCRSLEEFSDSVDLLQILTIVNYRMANMFLSHVKDDKEIDKKKQMPCFYSTLKKKVQFKRNIEPFISKDTQWFDARRRKHGSDRYDIHDPHSNKYNIKKAKCVLFLSIVDKSIGKEDSLVRRAIQLRTDFAYRKYSHKAFQSNFRKSKILQFLNQNCKPSSASETDCLICYFAAYSRYDFVCDADGRKITKKEIVEQFIGQLNKSFVGKPKIFIFLLHKLYEDENLPGERFYESVEPVIEVGTNSVTSGRQFHLGTDSVDSEMDQSINSTDGEFNTNTESTNDRCIGENLIPVHADILEICITVTDWKQAIGPMNLFREILKKSPTEDLLSLLNEFNCELFEKHSFFQMSKKSFSITSTLTKTLFLP